uniref:Uncharacterized protein n=1 Tax=viral metagenome TaxID=1070528 RepID=A0A6M3IZX8_9ZZZZ
MPLYRRPEHHTSIVRANLAPRHLKYLLAVTERTGLCRAAALRAILDDYEALHGMERADQFEDPDGRWAMDAYEER